MKSITVKTLCGHNDATTTLAPNGSPLGNFRTASLQVRRINNVPDDVAPSAVVKAFRETVDISWLGGREGQLEFDFAEIGGGKIIR
jgi:hypothetical protein